VYTRRRYRVGRALALSVALSIVLSACPRPFTFERQADGTLGAGLMERTEPFAHAMVAHVDAGEIFTMPFMLLVDALTLRFLWDHGGFPFSGLVGMLVRILAVLPGVFYFEYWPFSPGGMEPTYSPVDWITGG
jgi:hypothetical protein